SLWEKTDWLLGTFYTRENTLTDIAIVGANPSTGQIVGDGLLAPIPDTYREFAVFADLTHQFTDRIDLQIGARESHDSYNQFGTFSGPLAPLFFGLPSPIVQPELKSNDNVFSYLFTPRLRVSPEFMAYARLASGYRPGGPNVPGLGVSILQFNADKTRSYEL